MGEKIKKDTRKIQKVLMTTYDKYAIYGAVAAKGEWPKIMYSLTTAEGGKMTSFVFAQKHVYVTGTADTENSMYKEYQDLHFKQKSQKMGLKSLTDASSTLSIATKFAKSGMNFAMMMAYGVNEEYRSVLEGIGVQGGDPKAVANMFSFCEGSTPGEDPKCK